MTTVTGSSFKAARWLLALLCVCVGAARADEELVGKIQMIQPYLPQNMVYVHLKGYPEMAGERCSGGNALLTGRMDDSNFKAFIYPALLAAKATDSDIKIRRQGCFNGYPLIVGIEWSPRQ
jgi:hypothetical protein